MTQQINVIDAIYGRRSVRNYTPKKMDGETITFLLKAAVQAPTAMHKEPWKFVVIQDPAVLKRLSIEVLETVRKEALTTSPERAQQLLARLSDPDYNVFYNAGALIVLCGDAMNPYAVADCWLATQNILLAACSMKLGTCIIGRAVSALNSPAWKAELAIPADMTAYAPIIVGEPAGETPPVPRKAPEILSWKT